MAERLILWLVVLELLAGEWWWLRHRVVFRAGWKHIFFIPSFENVRLGDGSDCQTE